MPSDVLCDADLSCCWTNNGSHEALPPIRFLATRSWAGEHPIVGCPVTCVAAPRMQCLCQTRVKWNGLLLRLCFARANYLEHDGPGHADLIFLKVDIVPLETEELTYP